MAHDVRRAIPAQDDPLINGKGVAALYVDNPITKSRTRVRTW
jgi:hypothetical protein